ncbi:hypothetical protein SAMN05428952_11151 [Nitrosomonas sp. Nm132]|nr:hypothetical protein SAMN05428952_11151 [Nitrosomonas sp. Nm132]
MLHSQSWVATLCEYRGLLAEAVPESKSSKIPCAATAPPDRRSVVVCCAMALRSRQEKLLPQPGSIAEPASTLLIESASITPAQCVSAATDCSHPTSTSSCETRVRCPSDVRTDAVFLRHSTPFRLPIAKRIFDQCCLFVS